MFVVVDQQDLES